MNEQLRPLTLAEILDRTAQLYRSRFLVFLGISTIPAGIVFVFAAGTFAFIAWMGSNTRSGGSVSDVFVWVFLVLLMILAVPVSLGASALGAAAMSDAAARLFLGEAITIRSAYKNTWKRGWRYVGLFTLEGLVIVGAPALVFSVGIFAMIAGKVSGYATGDNSPLFGGLMFLLFVALGAFAVWMLLRFCLAFPVCVVEQATAWKALTRGVQLSDGTRGRILLLYILGQVLNSVLTWGATFVALITIALIPALQGQKHSQAAGMLAMFSLYGCYFAARALTKPIYGIALTIFYFDQRIRKEGFDIEWLMQQTGMVPGPAPETEAASPVLAEPATVAVPAAPAEAAALAESALQIQPDAVAAGEVPAVADVTEALSAQEQGLASAPEESKV